MPIFRNIPEFKRPREKLVEHGAESLKDSELLAILLRTGYKNTSALDVAERILQDKSLSELELLPLKDLAKIKGVGLAKAAAIIAAFNIHKRISSKDSSIIITSPPDVMKVVANLRTKKREYFTVLYLTARGELIKKLTISIGTLTESLIHPREVFAPAIKLHAAQVVLVHNHPSGNAEPSCEDVSVTQRIAKAGELLGITVTDHIIIAKNSYISLREKGELE
jgi:DNA repair protein RadC